MAPHFWVSCAVKTGFTQVSPEITHLLKKTYEKTFGFWRHSYIHLNNYPETI